MYTVRYGGKKGVEYKLEESSNFLAVRSATRSPVYRQAPQETTPLSKKARSIMDEFVLEYRLPLVGVEIWRAKEERGARTLRDEARAILKKEKDALRFAGRVVQDRVSKAPVLYTENLFVKFDNKVSESECLRVLRKHKLEVKRPLIYAPNAYFVEAIKSSVGPKKGIGLDVFDLGAEVLGVAPVELCHPELVREPRPRSAFPQQWHLKRSYINGNVIDAHANVEAAWAITRGEGTVIAVIDEGIDIDHEEFSSPDKIVSPLNASVPDNHPKRFDPRPGNGEYHGTACAGVACGDGSYGASGVAPKARLMPIRLVSGLGSQAEADAFAHAARFGADIISCSWGPLDGAWWDPEDPLHEQPSLLPDATRLAIDFATKFGRKGKGCVIVWAAGNGNESVDNDGYASYDKVIAVSACNDRSTKSVYSDYGKAIWCAFPSDNFPTQNIPNPLTPGIWTTDVAGTRGYNSGIEELGDVQGNYTNSFGGTSSAAPGVAGVAALILSNNPHFTYQQVKDVIKDSCDRIDKKKGKYSKQGHSSLYGYGRINAHSSLYGYGRINALKAVRLIDDLGDLDSGQVHFARTSTRTLRDSSGIGRKAWLREQVKEYLIRAIISITDLTEPEGLTWDNIQGQKLADVFEGAGNVEVWINAIQAAFEAEFTTVEPKVKDIILDNSFSSFLDPTYTWVNLRDFIVLALL